MKSDRYGYVIHPGPPKPKEKTWRHLAAAAMYLLLVILLVILYRHGMVST